jgi:hypothetical protein
VAHCVSSGIFSGPRTACRSLALRIAAGGPRLHKTRLMAAKAAYSAHALSGFQVSNLDDCAGLAQVLLYPGRP